MRFLCASPWNKSVIITALCRKTPIHQMVNYNQSLNYRLLGRAFQTIKSYLKHSDLRLKAVNFYLCWYKHFLQSKLMSVSSMQATHLFSFTDCHKWKQFCILHFASFAHCAQVVLSHCTIRSAVCAGSQSNNPYFVTALLSAHFSSQRLSEGLCISRLFLLSFFRPPRESGFWFIAENHKTEQRNRSIKNVSPIFYISPCPLP